MKTNKKSPVTVVSVNSHTIKQNAVRLRNGTPLVPPVAVRTGRSGTPKYPEGDLVIVDASGEEVGRVRYEPEGGLNCGARVFLELLHEPRVADPKG